MSPGLRLNCRFLLWDSTCPMYRCWSELQLQKASSPVAREGMLTPSTLAGAWEQEEKGNP